MTRWTRGDPVIWRGELFRLAYVTMDGSTALIESGPIRITVSVRDLREVRHAS